MQPNQEGISSEDILIVDDTPENLRLLSTMLSKKGYHVRKSLSGDAALTAVRTVAPDLILLDIMMPDMDGYTVCQELKAQPQTADIPIIFLSALHEAFDKVKAFQVGGADYITKPFQFEEVLTRVQNQLALRARTQAIETLNAQLEQRVQERTQQLKQANQELLREIARRRQIQAQLLEMALYDALTGLPNRALLMERLTKELQQTKANSQYQFALLFLDCDRFKVINDSLGHLAGDELLVQIARRLETCLTATDTLARLGGDEFVILLSQLPSIDAAIRVADQILKELNHPFQLQKGTVFITASIGIVQSCATYEQPEHLLRDADNAMYRAKASGKACYQLFNSTMYAAALHLLQLETDLRQAIERQELVLHYQPIVNLTSGKISGCEALVRWQHPEQGLLPPGLFIPLAEETGLITLIGEWVLRRACQQLRQWQGQNSVSNSFTMNVNLSARQLLQPDFLQQLEQTISDNQIDPQLLKLELTESITVDNTLTTAEILQKIKDRGIQLSIDDFGTGYSSLSYLHALPVESVKIDRSFVQRLHEQPENTGLIPAIIRVAQAMQMTVIAEGIETEQQLEHLRRLNCDFGQGYFFSPPLAIDRVTELLTSEPCW